MVVEDNDDDFYDALDDVDWAYLDFLVEEDEGAEADFFDALCEGLAFAAQGSESESASGY